LSNRPAYNGYRRNVIITHGWQSDGDASYMTSMKEAFLYRVSQCSELKVQAEVSKYNCT
jgi:hypothetical protein